MGPDGAVAAGAIGPKAGTNMTSSRNLAVQRCIILRLFPPGGKGEPSSTSDEEDDTSGWAPVGSGNG